MTAHMAKAMPVRLLHDHPTLAPLLTELVHAGYLVWQPASSAERLESWKLAASAGTKGHVHRDGNRYFGVDVSGMLPLYQEMYARIFAERLAIWGMDADNSAGVLRVEDLILFWGPDARMRAKQPAAVALQRIECRDSAWVASLEQRWHAVAVALETRVDHFWIDLGQGHTSAEALQSLVADKVTLAALGVDALMPPSALVEAWLAPFINASLLAYVVEGCYLPASGYLAYDVLEMECWALAHSLQACGYVPDAAREQFIRQGLFFLYNALNTDSKEYFFYQYPLETALSYGRAAPGREAIEVRQEEIRQRSWRRRYHHQWARQQIHAITGDAHARERLLVLHRLLGTARDFDEEKRRLNMKLWRALFALADGLGISLAQPQANLQHLCDAINRHGGYVTIDPAFMRQSHTCP
jgi:hypothetical protein